MLKQLRYVLTPPIFSDENQEQLASFLRVVLLTCFFVTLAHIVFRFFLTSNFFEKLWVDGIVLLSIISMWMLLRSGRVYLTGGLLPTALWLAVTAVVLLDKKGAADPAFVVYPVLLVITGFVWGGRGALLMSGVTGAISLVFVTPESRLLWLDYLIVFLVISVLLGVARHNIYQALKRVTLSERALELQNAMLRREIEEHQRAKTAQYTAEDKYRNIVENAVEGIFQSTPDGRILSANPALARMLGYDSPQALMTSVTDSERQVYVDPEHRRKWKALLEANGEVRGFETQMYRKQGTIIAVIDNTRVVRDEAGKVLYYEGILEDITDRKKAEEAVERERNLLRTLIDYLPENIYIKDRECRFLVNNVVSMQILGVSCQEDLIGKSDFDFFPHEMASSWYAQEQAVMESGVAVMDKEDAQPWNTDNRLWVEGSMIPLRDAKGTVIGIVGMNRDITERKQADEALRKSEERYRIVSELTSDYAYAYEVLEDGSIRYEWTTESFTRLTGFDDHGVNFSLYHPDDRPLVQADLTKTVAGQLTRREYRAITKTGEVLWLEVSRHPVWDETLGRVVRFYGVARNITERKNAEEAIAHERNLLRTLIDHLPENIYIKDRQCRFLVNNVVSMGLLGVSHQEDLIGKDDFDFFPREIAEPWYLQEMSLLETGEAIKDLESEQPWRGDFRRWVENSTIPLRDPSGQIIGLVGINRDISERKRVEEALRKSEERYRVITELISDSAFSVRVEPDGRLVQDWQTASVQRSTGYTAEELMGREVFSIYHPDDAKKMQRDIETILQGASVEGEYRLYAKNGEMRWIHNYTQPIFDEQQRVVRFYGVSQDITERKAAEAQQIELAVAAERQRVEVLKDFLSDATHDLRTPLSILSTSLYLLQKSTTPEKQKHYIDQLTDQTKRIKEIIENMFSLLRLDMAQEDFSFARWHLNELIQTVVAEHQLLAAQKQHRLVMELDPHNPTVVADNTVLMTALKHILTNALNYTPNGGLIHLKSYQENQCAVVEVTDNGIGISPEDLPRIFERFYRGDKARQIETGISGLGLTIARKIIQAHHGEIEVKSVAGQGSTFRIKIPFVREGM